MPENRNPKTDPRHGDILSVHAVIENAQPIVVLDAFKRAVHVRLKILVLVFPFGIRPDDAAHQVGAALRSKRTK